MENQKNGKLHLGFSYSGWFFFFLWPYDWELVFISSKTQFPSLVDFSALCRVLRIQTAAGSSSYSSGMGTVPQLLWMDAVGCCFSSGVGSDEKSLRSCCLSKLPPQIEWARDRPGGRGPDGPLHAA